MALIVRGYKEEGNTEFYLEQAKHGVTLRATDKDGTSWYVLSIDKEGLHLDTGLGDEMGFQTDDNGMIVVCDE